MKKIDVGKWLLKITTPKEIPSAGIPTKICLVREEEEIELTEVSSVKIVIEPASVIKAEVTLYPKGLDGILAVPDIRVLEEGEIK